MQRTRPYKATPFKRPRPSLKLARTQTFNLARKQSASPGFWSMRGSSSEKKFVDINTVYNAWNVSRTYIVLLNGVATGTDYNTRIGREVTMTSYYHRFFLSDTTNIQQVRCMLVS